MCHPSPQFRYALCYGHFRSAPTSCKVLRRILSCAVFVSQCVFCLLLLARPQCSTVCIHALMVLLGRLAQDVQALKTMEQSLGRPTAEVFASISPKPLAAASLGQVHLLSSPGRISPIIRNPAFALLTQTAVVETSVEHKLSVS